MKNQRKLAPVALLALFWVSAHAEAQDLDLTGYAGFSSRSFWQEALYTDQPGGSQTSMQAQVETYWRNETGRQRVSVVGFGRYDSEDSERSHIDFREAHWGYEADAWDLRLGISKVFWGVTESRHLVDVINQTDLVEDIDQEEKLGQPMLNFNLQRAFGRLEFYVLPRFRERTFPGEQGRFRTELVVDTDAAIFESSDGASHTDYAVRYSHYFGDLDLGIYVFDGTSREPRFLIPESGDRLLPFYEQMTQVGVDLQLTRGAWLLKLEALQRETQQETFAAAVGGVEYTFFGVGASSADVGLLFEYLYDDRSPLAPPTPFDDDIFVGARLGLNDASDTSLLAGAAIDRITHARFLNIEAERRFGENLTVAMRLRAFSSEDDPNGLDPVAQDDYLQLAGNWYF